MLLRGRPFQPATILVVGAHGAAAIKPTVQAQRALEEYAIPIIRKAIAEGLQGKPAASFLHIQKCRAIQDQEFAGRDLFHYDFRRLGEFCDRVRAQ